MDLWELGVEGQAEVLAIGPCAPVESGEGNLVTGTFRHRASRLVAVKVSGLAEPIRCTPNHPFWSEDRQDFLAAEQLRPGEQLLAFDGPTCRVESVSMQDTPATVYNLEIAGEHVYQVSPLGVLVHNNCWNKFQKEYAGAFKSRADAAEAYRGFRKPYFGTDVHQNYLEKWIKVNYKLNPGDYTSRVASGKRGVDITITNKAKAKRIGVEHLELKPRTESGLRTAEIQVGKWRAKGQTGKVRVLFYDAAKRIFDRPPAGGIIDL